MSNIKDKKPRDENGGQHGEWLRFYPSGQLKYREYFIHGVIHGLEEAYYSDGRLWFRGYWNMGKGFGYWYSHGAKSYKLCLI